MKALSSELQSGASENTLWGRNNPTLRDTEPSPESIQGSGTIVCLGEGY
jgi:hypothetical protein